MMWSACAVAGLLAPTVHAGMAGYSWSRPESVTYDPALSGPFSYNTGEAGVNDMAGVIHSMETSFDTASDTFSYSVTFDGQPGTTTFHETTGFWLVVSDGGMPSTLGGQTAQFFFDASGDSPVLSAYAYNGGGGGQTLSWLDGSGTYPGLQNPDQIFSSINDPMGDIVNEINVDTNDGLLTMSFSIDADIINEHSPAFPNLDGNPWEGVGFTDTLGIWMHPVTNVDSVYGTDGYLDEFDFARHGWWDGEMLATVESPVPAPGALALMALAAGRHRRRRN
ncbi:MAG: hypothetical protein AAF432_11845 [Planctomycetota bacterium]